MYRLVYVTILVFLTRVSADDSDKSCMKLKEYVNQSMICCEKHPVKSDYKDKIENAKLDEKIIECKTKSHESEGKKCSEREMCVAKNMGLAKENGDVDKDAINKLYKEEVKEILDEKAYENIEKYCMEGKPKDEDMCYFKFLQYCTGMHFMINCRQWSEDDSCKDMKDTANECSKKFS